MDDIVERDPVPEAIPISRCRDLLGNEGLDLSDEDVNAIRRHAHAMAHVLVEMFLSDAARALTDNVPYDGLAASRHRR